MPDTTRTRITASSAGDHAGAVEIILRAYQTQPRIRLAINDDANAIGSWSDELQRFVMVAALTITGPWVEMPYELLINGKRLPNNWTEVTRAEA